MIQKDSPEGLARKFSERNDPYDDYTGPDRDVNDDGVDPCEYCLSDKLCIDCRFNKYPQNEAI